VIRPQSDEHHDYRGYAGSVAGGVWRPGDEVVVLPSGHRSRVASIDSAGAEVESALPPESVAIRLADDIDVARGDMLADPEKPPAVARELVARVCWMSERPLEPRARIGIKHTTRSVRAIVDELVSVVDIASLRDVSGPEKLELNDIAVVRLRLSEPLAVDPYAENRETGSFILIDEASNDTVAAGMIVSSQ
jgi:sulfate adenylyltransferase subunit 1 (EFTu-like GTPase family)